MDEEDVAVEDTHLIIRRKCLGCSNFVNISDFTQKFTLCDGCIVKRDFIPRYERLADAQPEPPEWPPDDKRFIDSLHCPRSSQLREAQRFKEYTVGSGCFHTRAYLNAERVEREYPRLSGVQCSQKFPGLFEADPACQAGPDPSSLVFHTKVLLLTEPIEEISVYPSELPKSNGKEGIQGISFVKGDQVIDTGCLNRDRQLTLRLDEKSPFLRRITVQHTIWEVNAETHRLKKRITHLILQPFSGKSIIYGEEQPAGPQAGEWVCPAETATGTLVLVGVGFSHALPLSFQVVDCAASPRPQDSYLTLFSCRDVLSCVSVSQHLELYEHCRMPAVEDPEVYVLLDDLLAGIDNTSPSDTELLPNAIKFIDKTQRGNLHTMMAIFRMDRYLTHVIQTRGQVGMWDKGQNHWRKLLCLKQMMSIVTDLTMFSRKIHFYKPQLNVYTYGVLTGRSWDTLKASLTFITQSLLMVLCVVGMDISNLGEEMLFFYIAICVTAIVSFMVYEQIDNHFSALKTFSHAKRNPLMVLDTIANFIIPILVLLLNFTLLACTEQHLDMVTNATAVLCILEMDSAMLAADEEQIKDQLCAAAYKFLQQTISRKDGRYWIHAGLAKDKPNINVEHCSLIWPEPEKKAAPAR